MPKRNTYEDVKKLVESRGMELLSTSYNKNSEKLDFKCSEGHLFSATFASFKTSSNGCSQCAGNKKITYEDVVSIFEEKGCKLISNRYESANKPLEYECKCGNKTSTSLSKFKAKKKGCRKCAQKKNGFKSKSYSRQDLIDEFWRYEKEFNRYPTSVNLAENDDYPSPHYYYREFGKFNDFLRDVVCVLGENGWYKCDEKLIYKYYRYHKKEMILDNLMVKRDWAAVIVKARKMGVKREIHITDEFYNKDSLVKIFWQFYKKHKKYPILQDYNKSKDYPSQRIILKHFGTWNDYVVACGVCRKSGFKGWYLYEEKVLKKYYSLGKLEKIQSILPHRGKASICEKANEMNLFVKKEIRYKLKYKKNIDVINKIKNEVKEFYLKNGRSPYRYELSVTKQAIIENWKSYNDLLSECETPIFRKTINLKNKKDGIKFLINLSEELERIPTIHDAVENGASASWFTKYFGGYKKALYEANLADESEAFKDVKMANTLTQIEKLHKELGRNPTFHELKSFATENGVYHPLSLMQILNLPTYVDLSIHLFGESNRKIYDMEDLKSQLINLKEELGRAPMGKELAENGLACYNVYKQVFKVNSFSELIKDFGWKPTGHSPVFKSDEELLNDYKCLLNKLGRIPVYEDFQEAEGFASLPTYYTRFGGIENIFSLLDLNLSDYVLDIKLGYGKSCLDSNGGLCRSYSEMIISNILIDNNISYEKEVYYGTLMNNKDKRRFDWYLEEYDICVEFFGLQGDSSKSISKKYNKKTAKKIEDCEDFGIRLIALYKDDLRDGCRGLIDKFAEHGIKIKINENSNEIVNECLSPVV